MPIGPINLTGASDTAANDRNASRCYAGIFIGRFAGYGFSISADWKGLCLFGAEGLSLKQDERGDAEFSISIRELTQNYQVNLRFAKSDTGYQLKHTGEIRIGGIAIFDTPIQLIAGSSWMSAQSVLRT